MKFPKFTVRDMVNSQHELLTKTLHLNRIKAVIGVSMGGMQTFQWVVSYPEFMDKAIPVVGSPRMSSYDLLHWQTEIDIIRNDPGWKDGEYTENPAKLVLGEIAALLLSTPEGYNRQNTTQQVFESLERFKAGPAFDANNHIRQAQAVMTLDVGDVFGGSLERAAATVKARVLAIIAIKDHAVTPATASDFAKMTHAVVLELTSDCGHGASGCESSKVNPTVAAFLED